MTGCYPPRPNIEASPNVYVNGIAVHRETDGWATHCFTGDVELIVNEESIKFKDLSKNWKNKTVKSYFQNEIINTEIVNFFEHPVFELIEIEFENGAIIKCTPDHLFLLESGEYKKADELTEFDEIQSIK